ncbi:MAG: NAD(+)/NADH kinase [Thermoguttaceae bacterium]
MDMMRAILLGNGTKPGVLETVGLLRSEIDKRIEVVASDFSGHDDMSRSNADLAIVFGGDGSILRAVSQMGGNQIPVLAVHLGTLSFLSTIQADDLITILDQPNLLKKPVIEHLLLSCSVSRDNYGILVPPRLVLNEVLVQGESASRIMSIELDIDGELVTTYRGDGLIVSTPVGSTAHNLSAGGPIVRKDIDAVIISPISPHTLSNRPLVDSPDRRFEIRLQQKGVLVLDGGEVIRIHPLDRIHISRASQTFKMLDVSQFSYYKALCDKLGWTGGFSHQNIQQRTPR